MPDENKLLETSQRGPGRPRNNAKAVLVYLSDDDLAALDAEPWKRSEKIRSLIRWYAGKGKKP